MSVFKEKVFPWYLGIFWLIIIVCVLYSPWRLGEQQLARDEGIYATQSLEIVNSFPAVTAHSVNMTNAYPLYPLLTNFLYWVFGGDISMEFSLRILSFLFIIISAVVVWFAAGGKHQNSGLIASTIFLSNSIMLENAMEITPNTLAMFLVLLAQLWLFSFGFKQKNWDFAWIIYAVIMAIAFYTIGFMAIIYLVFPLLFLRRPLSVKSKFERKGFLIGVGIIALVLLIKILPYLLYEKSMPTGIIYYHSIELYEYFIDILTFPWRFFARLLPWSIIAWIPFCVALQNVDETPIYSKYLRTLVFANFALIWLLPNSSSANMLFVIGPLSILCGMHYNMAMRRYGFKMRIIQQPVLWAMFIPALAIVVFMFASREWLEPFISLRNSIQYRNVASYRITACIYALVMLVVAVIFYRKRKVLPIWLNLSTLMVLSGLFFWFVIHPYRVQNRDYINFGSYINSVLPEGENVFLYKHKILGLYSELYYAGVEVKDIDSLSLIDDKMDKVYLLDTKFPQVPERTWTNLFPQNYTYRNRPISLWCGELSKTKSNNEQIK